MWSLSLRFSHHHHLHICYMHSQLSLRPVWPASSTNPAACPSLSLPLDPNTLLNLVWTLHRAKSTNFPHFVNPMVHYRDHNSPTLVPIFRQINPFHSFPSFLFKIHINIILHYTPRSYKEFLAVRFFHKNPAFEKDSGIAWLQIWQSVQQNSTDCASRPATGYDPLSVDTDSLRRERPLALWRHASRQPNTHTHTHTHTHTQSRCYTFRSFYAVSDVAE
jgi:hypothetical protein